MYSFRVIFNLFVTLNTLTRTVTRLVQKTMCHIVSATGYRNPLYAKIHLLNMMTHIEIVIHTATKKYALRHDRAMVCSLAFALASSFVLARVPPCVALGSASTDFDFVDAMTRASSTRASSPRPRPLRRQSQSRARPSVRSPRARPRARVARSVRRARRRFVPSLARRRFVPSPARRRVALVRRRNRRIESTHQSIARTPRDGRAGRQCAPRDRRDAR